MTKFFKQKRHIYTLSIGNPPLVPNICTFLGTFRTFREWRVYYKKLKKLLKIFLPFSPNLVASHTHIYPIPPRAIALDQPRTPRPWRAQLGSAILRDNASFKPYPLAHEP